MKNSSQNKIEWFSQQIQIDPLNKSFIIQRSDAYQLQGKYDEAITDCSKLIILQPSRQYYVKRSRLLQNRKMFSLALQDLADASKLQKGTKQERDYDIFLEKSACIKNLKQVEQMALLIQESNEKNKLQKYTKTLQQLLHVKQLKIEQIQQKHEQQIQNLKKFYQQQTIDLKNILLAQLQQLRIQVKHTVHNYQKKFEAQLELCQFNSNQKQKIKIYFQKLSSEMEKYYIAAKNLHTIQDKSLRFQDFQKIIMDRDKSSDFMRKIYKIFDKYSSQIQKIVSVIQTIPYIGYAFKIVKASLSAKNWADSVNIQAQCHNIEHIAITTSAFNQFSTNLAFYLAFHYSKKIIASHAKYKSEWEQFIIKIKELKHQKFGVENYKTPKNPELQAVKDYATIHASIIMVAYACNKLHFTRENLDQLNEIWQNSNKNQLTQKIEQVYTVIDEVQDTMLSSEQKTIDPKITPIEKEKTQKSYCLIY